MHIAVVEMLERESMHQYLKTMYSDSCLTISPSLDKSKVNILSTFHLPLHGSHDMTSGTRKVQKNIKKPGKSVEGIVSTKV